MSSVINIDDFKKEPSGPTGIPTVVSMVWESQTRTYKFNYHIADGDIDECISIIRDNGGVYQDVDDTKGVYLPWPPSYIDIVDKDAFVEEASEGP